jgi:hypothetical protein
MDANIISISADKNLASSRQDKEAEIMTDFIMMVFGIGSAITCYLKAREAERKGEPGTASYYILISLLIMLNVIFVYLLHYRFFLPR